MTAMILMRSPGRKGMTQASAGFISAKFVVEETRDESHRDVSNDITACDAEGNANPSGPAGKDGNADAAEQYIDNLAESGTSPARGTERGASMQVTAAQRAQRTRSCVVIFMMQ